MRIPYILCLFTLVLTGMVSAQRGQLNLRLEPRYGAVQLQASSRLPHELSRVEVVGEVDASTIGGCAGFTSEAPTYRVFWSQGGGNPLRFSFESDQDTTLIVNTANGEWVCNDDSEGLNPAISIPSAPEGQYDIWVGRFNPRLSAVGTLRVSTTAMTGGGQLEFGRPPRYGAIMLQGSGQLPHELAEVQVIGDVNASNVAGCMGFTTSEPTYRVFWSQGGGNLLRFSFESDQDTTLIVNTANGQWVCNDDSAGLNPAVTVPGAPEGQYDIWVGHFERGRSAVGRLRITAGEMEGSASQADSICDPTPLGQFDPQVIDDNTVEIQYRNDADQVFNVLVTGEGVGSSRLQLVRETRLCLVATGPMVFPGAAAADTGEVEQDTTDEQGLIALEIAVVSIRELVDQDYEVHMALDPPTPFSVSLPSARAATITSLCCTRGVSVLASLYNPNRIASNPALNRVYQLVDASGGTCARMLRSNGTTLYATAKQLYVSGTNAYFTLRSTWGNFN
jgi:hypothetical protein